MCAIIGWAGKVPMGFMTQILREAETRGRDSVGLAYRLNNETITQKQASSATRFAKEQEKILGEARRSVYGIGHTRRASPGMPINDENAHPFIYAGYIFAHNGRVENYRDLRSKLAAEYRAAGKTARADYFDNAQTDSMVLGEYIEKRDFAPVEGSLGLVWMKGGKVYAFHSAKELCAFNITWWVLEPRTKEEEGYHTFSIVASTPKMVLQALNNTRGAKRTDNSYATIAYDYGDVITLDEGVVYRVEPPVYQPNAKPTFENLVPGSGIINEGRVPVNPANHTDAFSSAEDDAQAAQAAGTAPEAPTTAVAVGEPATAAPAFTVSQEPKV